MTRGCGSWTWVHFESSMNLNIVICTVAFIIYILKPFILAVLMQSDSSVKSGLQIPNV